MDITERLEEIKQKIESNKASQTESIRTILSWFGVKRRGVNVITYIERKLSEHHLSTTPQLSEPWIGGSVEINLSEQGKSTKIDYDSMTARLVHLDAANQTPISVKPESTVAEAIAKMLTNDFSQLPVMKDDRTAVGFISWQSLGEATALGKECKNVSQCMKEGVQVLKSSTSLTDAIDQIIKHEFIMVEGVKKLIYGPVTTTDLSMQYHNTAKPFLLIGQIEASIRKILDSLAPVEILQSAKFSDDSRDIQRPEDLTFSEYKTVLLNEKVWDKLEVNICKNEVSKIMETVRIARNDVMHFHPDDESDESINILSNAAKFFDQIAKVAITKCTY